MSYDSDENQDEPQTQDEQDDETFELIRKVEGRPFIYNCRDPKHSKRDAINDAWNDIANGFKIKGKPVNGMWCRKKWKALRDYYYKVKRSLKGKSGDAAKDKKMWTYFGAMDRVLSSYNEENDNTQNNFPEDDSIENESFGAESDSNENDRPATNESTQTAPQKTKRKRKATEAEDLLNEKILKVLEEPEEVKDQFYHFGMTICNKLRNAPAQTAEYAMTRISCMLYEILYPGGSYDNSAGTSSFNKSTHYEQL